MINLGALLKKASKKLRRCILPTTSSSRAIIHLHHRQRGLKLRILLSVNIKIRVRGPTEYVPPIQTGASAETASCWKRGIFLKNYFLTCSKAIRASDDINGLIGALHLRGKLSLRIPGECFGGEFKTIANFVLGTLRKRMYCFIHFRYIFVKKF
ncbi:hypothetical protein CEXT_452191 [Caerostris extrusa]|uniref:Uncharacterized protein n=1 Tax=Caerostris extrusa TaxID=172846 RepID=A0AAV4MD82_CAEEX|nr:hypothetical protein CEXT_452191 [Caerostris extrusa]